MEAPNADLSYDAGETEPPLLRQTIPQNLAGTVARCPAQEALVDVGAGRRWTYAQFHHDVRALATGLHRLGVRTGDRVGIWGPNTWQWTLVQYATAELGAVLVNINPAYRSHELAYVLRQSGISTVVAHPRFRSSDYPGMLDEVRDGCPDLRRVVVMGTAGWDEPASAEVDEALLAGIAAGLDPEDPINIQYTSGTTGFPKGATLSHRNILNNGYFIGELLGYTETDRVCIPVPLYHCFGMVIGNLACTTHGSCAVLPAPAFTAESALRAVEQESCTSLYGVPTMFIAELGLGALDAFDLSSLRTGVMAGSTCPAPTMRAVIERMNMREVGICYGMTETSPVSTQTRRDDSFERRTATVGRVGPHLEVKIIDPLSGGTVPRGTAGEFCTRGYSVMKGYWNEPERTAEAIDHDGWMHTGDLGAMDEDGYVQITGRIKDMVIRGGENIYPREVEEFLLTHPDVLDAQVIGVPDPVYGEEVMAWLRLRDGAEPLTAESLRSFCDGRIARYKIPRYVHLADEFPMTVTGKVRKVEMREESVRMLDLRS
ncbi:AMP-binding protein [Kocuria rosea]|uniref:AMP-binding protein n=1 Tax=Kocuria rosea TaxID=1275 RepID=A0A4R5YN61_KOCRO|nr:AMP-binding protein [Kocuria rosea]TDL44764.1 AMP-binding protein [Kocuria rosea]